MLTVMGAFAKGAPLAATPVSKVCEGVETDIAEPPPPDPPPPPPHALNVNVVRTAAAILGFMYSLQGTVAKKTAYRSGAPQ